MAGLSPGASSASESRGKQSRGARAAFLFLQVGRTFILKLEELKVLRLKPGNWRRVGGRAGEKTEGHSGPQTRRLLSLMDLWVTQVGIPLGKI